MNKESENNKKKFFTPAMIFLILFGVVSLFSDMTHEGASSIQGTYLNLIGADAATIGFISGLGELIGYSLRLVFGKLTDKTKKYWPMVIIGYLLDTMAVPLLGLVGSGGWIWACVLIVVQKVGKAVKKPAKDTVMSFAATQNNVGKSFGFQEMLDQIGAFLGPLLLFLVMLTQKSGETLSSYSLCFFVLAGPAAATLALLFFTWRKFPNPDRFEPEPKVYKKFKMKPSFILYIVGISLFAFGFIDYSLVGMHISNVYVAAGDTFITDQNLPLIYSLAMLVDAIAALVCGKAFDRWNTWTLVAATVVSGLFGLFIFLFDSIPMLLIGVCMWGVGMGAQESILKAAVTTMVPKNSRATGYGIFECSFGVFWFLGSWIMGILYDLSLPAMVGVSVAAQMLSIPCYILSSEFDKKEKKEEA